MRNKILKIGFLIFTLLSIMLFSNKVEAKNCEVYKDYYYFLDSTTHSFYLDNQQNGIFERMNAKTYVPAGYAANAILKEQGQIEIAKESAANGEWTLKDYYEKFTKIISQNGTSISTPDGEDEVKIYIEPKESESEIDVTRHILHGIWYEENKKYGYGVVEDYKKNETVDSLIKSSVIPTKTIIKFEYNKSKEIFDVLIDRTVSISELPDATDGATATIGGELRNDVINAPAVYYIVYNYCTYTGTINYYDAETKKEIEFEDGSDNPYVKTGMEAGEKEDVLSPELKDCTPDKEKVTIEIDKDNPEDVSYDVYYTCKELYNAKIDYVYEGTEEPVKEEDKVADSYYEKKLEDGYTKKVESPKIAGCITKDTEVEVSIDGKDFYKKVEYTCEIKENEPTGSFLIYVAWIIGLGALGYSVYYFMKLKKENK